MALSLNHQPMHIHMPHGSAISPTGVHIEGLEIRVLQVLRLLTRPLFFCPALLCLLSITAHYKSKGVYLAFLEVEQINDRKSST